MAAVVNVGDDGCADFGGIGDLALDGGLGGAALVDAAHGVDHALLPGKLHQVVVAAGEVPDGLGLQFGHGAGGDGRGGGEGGELGTALGPEQIGEATAVGMAGGIEAAVVDAKFAAEAGEHRVEKLQITVVLRASSGLPARFFALGIGEGAGSVEALRIDDDGFGPERVKRQGARGVAHGAAVTMEDEYNGRGYGRGVGRKGDEGFASYAGDGPGAVV